MYNCLHILTRDGLEAWMRTGYGIENCLSLWSQDPVMKSQKSQKSRSRYEVIFCEFHEKLSSFT